MGTYIEKPENVFDNARVFDNAQVFDNARVSGGAWVSGGALVSGGAWVSGDGRVSKTRDYIIVGPAISSGHITTAHRDAKLGVRVNCGCFSGTLAEFKAAIERTHKGPPLEQYRCFASMIEAHFALADWQDQIDGEGA